MVKLFSQRFEILLVFVLASAICVQIFKYPAETWQPAPGSVTAAELDRFHVLHDSFQKYGQIPFWDKSTYAGQPAVDGLFLRIYYPGNLPGLFVAPEMAVGLSIFLHLLLGGIFMSLLLRGLGSGSFGALCGATAFILFALFPLRENLPFMIGLAWLPLCLLALDKLFERHSLLRAVLLGLALGMQFYGADILSFGICGIFLIFVALYRLLTAFGKDKLSAWPLPFLLLLSVVILGLMGAGRLLPLFHHYANSVYLGQEATGISGFSPASAYLFFFPKSHVEGYVGVAILTLACATWIMRRQFRMVYAFATLIIVTALYALGQYSPVMYAANAICPFLNLLDSPQEAWWLGVFALCALSGLGAHAVISFAEAEFVPFAKKRLSDFIIIAALSGMAIGMLFFTDFVTWAGGRIYSLYPHDTPFKDRFKDLELLLNMSVESLTILGGLLLACWLTALGLFWSVRKVGIVPAGTVIFAILVITASARSFPLLDTEPRAPKDNPLLAELRPKLDGHRVLNIGRHDFVSVPGEDAVDIRQFGGPGRFVPADFYQYARKMTIKDNIMPEKAQLKDLVNKNLLALSGIKYVLSPNGGTGEKAGLTLDNPINDVPCVRQGKARLRATGGLKPLTSPAYVYESANPVPRFYAVGQASFETNRAKLLTQLIDPNFHPLESAILEGSAPKDRLEPLADPAEVTINLLDNYDSPNSVRLKVGVPVDRCSYLIINERWDRDWRVFDNGNIAQLYRANYLYSALLLQPGDHTVVLQYRSKWHRIGLLISLLSLTIIITALSLRIYFKQRNLPLSVAPAE